MRKVNFNLNCKHPVSFRIFDLLIIFMVALPALFLSLPILAFNSFATRSPIFRQERVGIYGRPFTLLKFRTLHDETPSCPTHLLATPKYLPLGRMLRRSKLDELPQLINVLRGEMSLVGPRPCLTTQSDLISMRVSAGIYEYLPGVTGLAQTLGINMEKPDLLVQTELLMIRSYSLRLYLIILFRTLFGSTKIDRKIV